MFIFSLYISKFVERTQNSETCKCFRQSNNITFKMLDDFLIFFKFCLGSIMNWEENTKT